MQETSEIDLASLSNAELYALAWRAGKLAYLLRGYQRPIYEQVKTRTLG